MIEAAIAFTIGVCALTTVVVLAASVARWRRFGSVGQTRIIAGALVAGILLGAPLAISGAFWLTNRN